MPYLVFAVAVLFSPWLPAGATVPRMALLSVALPAMAAWKQPHVPNPVLAVGGVLLLWGLLNPSFYGFLSAYWLFLLWAAAFCLARELVDMRCVFVAAALGLTLNSVVVLGQYLDGWQVTQAAPYSGLFGNRNYAVEAAAMTAAGLACYRLWWLLPGLLPTLVVGSRGPVVALGAAAAVYFWGRSKAATVGVLLLALGTAVLLSWQGGVLTQYSSITERLDVWRDVVANLTVFGHGFGSFDYLFPTTQDHTDALAIRFDHPHNDALQILYELGAVGCVLLGLLATRLHRSARSPEWYAFLVFLVEGCFGFPLFMPVTGLLAALCLGHLSRDWGPLRRSVPAGGRGLPARAQHAHRRAV